MRRRTDGQSKDGQSKDNVYCSRPHPVSTPPRHRADKIMQVNVRLVAAVVQNLKDIRYGTGRQFA